MKTIEEIRESLHLLRINAKPLIAFELVFGLLSGSIVLPLAMTLLRESLSLAELSYLSNDTLAKWLTCPLTIPILLIVALTATFLTITDMAAVIRCYDESQHGRRISCWQMLCYGARDALRVFLPQNWRLLFFVLLVIPATNILEVSGVLREIYLPEFISDYISSHLWLWALMAAGTIALYVLAVRWAFSIHFFVLERLRAGDAARHSRQMMRRRTFRVLWGRLILGLFFLLLLGLLGVGLCVGAIALCKHFLSASDGYQVSLHLLYWIPATLYSVYQFFAVPIVFSYLEVLFRHWNSDSLPDQGPLPWPHAGFVYRFFKLVGAFCITLALLVNTVALCFSNSDGYRLLRSSPYTPDITAHRGSSLTAPENSIPAFQGAIYDQADWIELDVHQTSDGVVVVTHDADLSRITGEHVQVWGLTYRELEQYETGSWFSEEYRGLHVATLEEVLRLCKGKMRLNIELKPTGHEKNFVQNVIQLVRRYGFSSSCILASMDAETLRQIKQIAPDIRTLYNMVIAEGDITWISYADMFSVEESYVTQELVDRVHAAGKKIFVWTVNDANSIRSMAALHVDNIITDNPWMARQALGNDRLNKSAGWLLRTYVFPNQGEASRSISLEELVDFLFHRQQTTSVRLTYGRLSSPLFL